MKYDSIILELLARIQALEEAVAALSGGRAAAAEPGEAEPASAEPAATSSKRPEPKVSTSDVRNYIMEQKREAAARGETELTFKASAIHRELKMKNRIPMVTNAMRQCMAEGDEVLHDTPSGKSSTLEIRFYLPSADNEEV